MSVVESALCCWSGSWSCRHLNTNTLCSSGTLQLPCPVSSRKPARTQIEDRRRLSTPPGSVQLIYKDTQRSKVTGWTDNPCVCYRLSGVCSAVHHGNREVPPIRFPLVPTPGPGEVHHRQTLQVQTETQTRSSYLLVIPVSRY